MRELKPTDRNELVIQDARSGGELTLYYRTPTTKEEALYQSRFVKKKGNKVVMNAFETRLKFGLDICTGFKDGSFSVDGRTVSTDPASPDYYPDWKGLLASGASDVVRMLAMTVFEGARVGSGAGELVDEAEVIEEQTVPFGRN